MAWKDPLFEQQLDTASGRDLPRRGIDLGAARQALDERNAAVSDIGRSASAGIREIQQSRQQVPGWEPAELAYNQRTGEWAVQGGDGSVRVVDKSPATLFALSDMKLPRMGQLPDGFRPVTQTELREILSSIPEQSDFWGQMGASFKTSIGLAAASIDALIGNDDPNNDWGRAQDAYTKQQTIGEYKASEAPWYSSLPAFTQGLGETLGNIGGSVAAAAPVAVGASFATGNPISGVATGALALSGAAGAAGEQATDFYTAAMSAMQGMSEDQLLNDSPIYRQARADGLGHDEAMQQTAIEGARVAMLPAASVGAIEGAVGGVIGKQILGRFGASKLAGALSTVEKRAGIPMAIGRTLGRATAGGAAAGTSEVAETAFSQAAGAGYTGIGSADPRDYATMREFEQASQGGFLLGALGGRGHANAETAARSDLAAALAGAGEQTPGVAGQFTSPTLPADVETPAALRRSPIQGPLRAPPPGPQGEMNLGQPPADGVGQTLADAVADDNVQALQYLLQSGQIAQPGAMESAAAVLGVTPDMLQAEIQNIVAGSPQPSQLQAEPAAPVQEAPPASQGDLFVDPAATPVPNLAERRAAQQMRQQEAQAASEASPPQLALSDVSKIEQEITQLREAIAMRPKRDRRLKPLRIALKDAEQRLEDARAEADLNGAAPYAQVDSPEPAGAPAERTADGRPVGVTPPSAVNPEPMAPEQAAQAAETRAQRRRGGQPVPTQQPPVAAPPAAAAEAARQSDEQVSPSTPEPTEDIQAQVDAMLSPDSQRDAVFVAEPGDLQAPKGAGVIRVQRPGVGVLLTTNAAKAREFRTRKMTDARLAQMLGYSETKADTMRAGEAPVVVEARTKRGAVAAQQLTSPKNARAAEAAVRRQARRDVQVVTTTPEAAQADRAARAKPKNPRAAAAAERKAERQGVKKKSADAQRQQLEAKGLNVASDAENARPASKQERNDQTAQERSLARASIAEDGAPAPRLSIPRAARAQADEVATAKGKQKLPVDLTVETGARGNVVDLTVTGIDEPARARLQALQQAQLSAADAAKVSRALLNVEQTEKILDTAVDAAEERLLSRVERSPDGAAALSAAEARQLRSELQARRGERGRPHGRPKASPLVYVPLLSDEMLSFGRLVRNQARDEVKNGTHGGAQSVARRLIPQLLPQAEALMSNEAAQKQVVTMLSKFDDAYVDQLVRSAAPRLQDSLLAKQVMRGVSEVARASSRQDSETVKEVKRRTPSRVITASDLDLQPQKSSHVTSFKEDLPKQAVDTMNEWLQLLERGGVKMSGEVRLMSMDAALSLYPEEFPTDNLGRYVVIDEGGKEVHLIAVNWKGAISEAVAVEAMSHEFGHYVSREVFNRSDRTTQQAVVDAYHRWLQTHGHLSPAEIFRSHAPGAIQAMPGANALSYEYATSFNEWSANHVARYLLTDEKPRSTVEKYFARVADVLRKIYQKLFGAKPNQAWRDAVESWIAGAAAANASPLYRMAAESGNIEWIGEPGGKIERPGGERTAQAVLNRATAAIAPAKDLARDVFQLALSGNVKGLELKADTLAEQVMKSGAGKFLRRTGLALSTLDQIERRYRNTPFGESLSNWTRLQKQKAQMANVALNGGTYEGVKFMGAADVLEAANQLDARVRDMLQDVMYYATHYGIHPEAAFNDKRNEHLTKGVDDRVKAANERRYNHLSALYDQMVKTDQTTAKVYADLRDAFTDLHEKTLQRQIENIEQSEFSDRAKADAIDKIKAYHKTLQNGPYFPLMRFGDIIVTATQPAEATFHETKGKAEQERRNQKALNPGARIRIEKVDDEWAVRVYRRGVYFFDSVAEAEKAMPQIEADLREQYEAAGVDVDEVRKALTEGKLDEDETASETLISQPFQKTNVYRSLEGVSPFIAELRAAIKAEGIKLDPEMAQIMENLYIEAMPELSARKSMLPRQNVLGASRKMLQSYAMRFQGAAHAYSGVAKGQAINKAWAKMEEGKRTFAPGGDIVNNLRASQEAIAARTRDSLGNKIANMATDASSLFSLAFSPAYVLTNAMQPLMISLPVLAGASWMRNNKAETVGVPKATAYLKDAYEGTLPFFTKRGIADFVDEAKRLFGQKSEGSSLQNTAKILVEKFGKTADEREMLTQMLERGRLDFSFLNSIEDAMRGGLLSQKFGAVARLGMALPQQVEAMNRVVTALASYRIAKTEMHLDPAEATEYAYDVVGDTQLDYSRLNRPLVFNKPLLNVLLQFKLYLQGMYMLFARNAYLALKGASEAERRQGRRTLMYMLGTHGAIGGATGLGPLTFAAKAAIAATAMMMGRDDDDDEWKSSEQLLAERSRYVLGDTGGQAFERGLPALLGLDVADRIGIPVLADTRFTGITERDDAGSQLDKWTLYTLGAPYSNLRRVVKAGGAAADDDPFTKVSDGLPAGPRAMWRALQASRDGLVDRDGDQFVPASDLNWRDIGVSALGFQPNTTSRAYRERAEEKGTLARVQEERKLLLKLYRTADSTSERDEVRSKVSEFNQKAPKPFRITADALSRSAAQKQQRDAGKQNRQEAAIKEYLK